jgi:DNA-binding beta-propeller fold protein YncE
MAAPALLLSMLPLARGGEAVKLRTLPPIYLDEQGGRLERPEGIACGGGSLLAVADTGNGRILTYNVSGDSITPARSLTLRELPYPRQVQFNPAGELVALDGRLRRLARLAPSGAFIGYLEIGAGSGGRPVVPRSFRIDGAGGIHLLDIANGRVLVLGPEGERRREIALPDGEGSYADLAVDGRGTVFVLESVGKRVFVAGPDDAAFAPLGASLRTDLAFPTYLTVDGLGRIFIADEYGGGIVILGPDGSFRGRQSKMGWEAGLLRYPSALCVDGAGTLYVADRGNNRIQPFSIAASE